MSAPAMCVVIASSERTELLCRTVHAMRACRLPPSYAGAWIVHNPSDLTTLVPPAADDPLQCRRIGSIPARKGTALNAVLPHLPDGLIVFVDDDIDVCEEFLIAYAEAGARHPAGAFFGGPVVPRFDAAPDARILKHLPRSVVGLRFDDEKPSKERMFLGGNWACYKRDLVAIGGFDERFGPGAPSQATGQESAVQRRLLATGLQAVYVARSVATHYVPASRCDLAWLAHRKFREGAENGIYAHDEAKSWDWVLARSVRWAYRWTAWTAARIGGRSSAVEHRMRERYHRGLLHGWLWSRRTRARR